ncbi:MAG: hypothetical protein ACREBD_03995 [Blastocatellia bacterium]
MNHARLIKRGATSEQKTIASSVTPQKPVAKTTIEVVRKWLTERRTVTRPEARQAFAALFALPQPSSPEFQS